MNRSYIDRGWTIERRDSVGQRYQRMMAAKTRALETAFAATFVRQQKPGPQGSSCDRA
jgi:hypothetical protein